MLEEMKALARKKDTCVLATVSGTRPHCSLMAYVTEGEDWWRGTLIYKISSASLMRSPSA